MTSHEPENPQFAEHENPDTEVISVAPPAPVFVDTTGRRSRLLRRLAYGFGGLVMVYGGLISVSLAGGPVRSSAVLPLPGLDPPADDAKAPSRPSPTPAPTPGQTPTALFVTDALPRQTAPRDLVPRLESTRITSAPAAKPTATKKPTASSSPTPTATTTKPVESTTTSPATTPATTPPATTPADTPVHQVPPAPPAGTGGQGGGSSDAAGESPATKPPATKAPTVQPTDAGTPAPEVSA